MLCSRRLFGIIVGILFVVVLAPASPQAVDNPIVVENQQPGSGGWMWTRLADDVNQQIKGYASATSVSENGTITLYVSVNPAQTYTIDVYRVGWYGGAGGRLRLSTGPLSGFQQAACPTDATTGMIACTWTPSYTLPVPSDWTSGVYLALLTNSQGYQNYVVFVVKDGRPAAFLYQQSVDTDQAYNNYPNDGATGKSLYAFNSYGVNTQSGNASAVEVSFDRPYSDGGFGNVHKWEMQTVRWLERMGYDVTYTTNVDTHVNPGELLRHRAFLSVGHDEYWSKEMRDAVEAARDSGVNLAFFGANASYTQIRFEPSATGVANRVIVEYRSYPWAITDPVQGPTTTTDFRQPPVSRPEQTLIGVMFSFSSPNVDYVVTNSNHWVYAGTGLHDGDHVAAIVGYEEDAFLANYPPPNSANQTLLSNSPYTDPGTGATTYSNSSIYQAPSGAWVFATGTMSWSWALDDAPGPLQQFRVDTRIQQATANVLNVFLNGLTPTITNIAPANGPAGTSVTITGTNFTGATSVKLNGTAATFTVASATSIQSTVPAGTTSGPFSVTTSAGTATSTANFIVTARLTVSKTSGPLGLGTGTITSSPGGITCGGACAATYTAGTAVTLTATADGLSIFNGWTGCDTVNGNTCTVTIRAARTVVANFLP